MKLANGFQTEESKEPPTFVESIDRCIMNVEQRVIRHLCPHKNYKDESEKDEELDSIVKREMNSGLSISVS
jgi:hypothetical protein